MNDIYSLWWHLLIYYLWRCLLIDNLRRNLLINHLWLYPTISSLFINCLRSDSLCFLFILILYYLFVIHNIFCYLLHYYYYTIVPFKYPHKKAWHIFALIGSLRSSTTWHPQLQRLMSTPKGGSFVALFRGCHFESVEVSKNPESSYLAFSYFKMCVSNYTYAT